ncbi:metal ABC transporter ATP-binding protein [Corynebacterium afermentans]|uniref:metal ABC transporter ATP-binding protein n=1 Tax=Corynebacterium afermentans TaxID=38286 RepID=UPI002572A600|nr:metal ABC transporter ATP-binding protein [Corynebacterium afermentans]
MTPAIAVEDVSVRYGDVAALDGATVTVQPGRICGLIGMNGAGKSTLLKAVMGLVHPDRGTVRINGMDPQRARKSQILGYVPQSEEVDWQFPVTVRDVVMMGRYGRMGLTRRPREEDVEAVSRALARTHLEDFASRQIGQLSGGQKKRAFIARGIAQGASIMLLDEPFAGVDTNSEATITALLHELAAEGTTVVVVTHDLVALPKLAPETVLLNRRVLMHAPTEVVLEPDNLVQGFGMGVPA